MGWLYFGPEAIAAADPVEVLRELAAACRERGIAVDASGFMTWSKIRTLVYNINDKVLAALTGFINPAKLSIPDISQWNWTLDEFIAADGAPLCATRGSFLPLLRVEWVWQMQRMLNAMYVYRIRELSTAVDYEVLDLNNNMVGTAAEVEQFLRHGTLRRGKTLMNRASLTYYQYSVGVYGQVSTPGVRWLADYSVRVDWVGWLASSFDFSGLGLSTSPATVLRSYSGEAIYSDMPAIDREIIVFPPLSGSVYYSEVKAHPVCYANVPGGYDKYIDISGSDTLA